MRGAGRPRGPRRGPLNDLLAPGLRLLLVGINPGLGSAAAGHHFAGKGNPFWRLLHAAGLTPVLLAPADEARLLSFGIGLTNLCSRPSRTADELAPEELVRGAARLRRVVRRHRPRRVGLVGVSIYRTLFPRGAARGAGPAPERLAGAPLFVLPNPSGLNASYPGFRDKLVWFERLARELEADDRRG